MIPIGVVLPLAFFFQAQAPPTYTVAGTVVDSVTGRPLSHARVFLAGTAQPFATAADGKFRFDGVRAGPHQLSVERLGYYRQSFMQRTLSANLSSAIVAGEKQPIQNLVFRMIPGAAIAGYVRSAAGDPVVGMNVALFRVYGAGRGRRIMPVKAVATDDRGYYRLNYLSEGTYTLVVNGRPRQEIPSVEPMAYPVTFFPGSADPAAAELISVKPGEDRPADITLHAVPAVTIEGKASALAGIPFKQAQARLMGPALFGVALEVGVFADVIAGEFTFPNSPAGKYRLILDQLANDQSTRQTLALEEIDAATNPTKISIAPSQPLLVSIHVSVNGRPQYPNQPLTAAFQALSFTNYYGIPLDKNGRGDFPGYPPLGRYTLVVRQGRPLPVTSVKINGAAQPGRAFDLDGAGPVEVDATVDAAVDNVIGHVSKDGMPEAGVLVMLAQRETWEQIGVYSSDQSNTDGGFQLRDVPPGDYLAFVLPGGEPQDYDDADSLRALLPIGQLVTLTDDPVQRIDLKLLPMPAK